MGPGQTYTNQVMQMLLAFWVRIGIYHGHVIASDDDQPTTHSLSEQRHSNDD